MKRSVSTRREFLEGIGDPSFVIGHSYGAVCSLEAALLTDRVRRMVLYEPPIPTGLPFYPEGTPVRMQALIDEGASEAALEMFFREVVRMPEHEFEQYRELPMWDARIRLVRHSRPGRSHDGNRR